MGSKMTRQTLDRREFLELGVGAGLALASSMLPRPAHAAENRASLIVSGGRIATLDPARPFAEALAIRDGRVLATGSAREVLQHRGAQTQLVDLRGHTAIPGLNDSHIHPIRGGLHYNLELRWDGIASLAEALERLRLQARNTPPPQWVRVVGGWSEFQFREGRLPTLDEINAAAPETPVFILHLYDQALLNRAALRVLGFDEHPPAFDRGVIVRDEKGRATGLLVALRHSLPVGSSVNLVIRPDLGSPLAVQGEVVRSMRAAGKGASYEVGVRLLGDPSQTRNLILFPRSAAAS